MQNRPSSAPQGRVVMVQGTASHVGKSVLVTALCRIFRQDGYRVAPFKAQNMSNNSFVTPSGGELGRAQAVQAEACGVEPQVEMNPILLKPEADHTSQVVLLGKPAAKASARYFATAKPMLWQSVASSLDTLRSQYDVVVIEGAGSPAEINLKQNEIVNMRVALHSGAPVLLTGDIDRGGVFASLLGTMEILEPHERDAVGAFIINKFRGDVSLLEPGLVWLEERTGKPVLGVVPYYRDIEIAEEDSVSLERRQELKSQTGHVLDIAVMGLPHISNFDDFDPLQREPGVRLRYVESRDSLGEPDLIILPGTKTTMADLWWLRERGFAAEIKSAGRRRHSGHRHLRRLPDDGTPHIRPRRRGVPRPGSRWPEPAAGGYDFRAGQGNASGARRSVLGHRPAGASGKRRRGGLRDPHGVPPLPPARPPVPSASAAPGSRRRTTGLSRPMAAPWEPMSTGCSTVTPCGGRCWSNWPGGKAWSCHLPQTPAANCPATANTTSWPRRSATALTWSCSTD